MSKSRFIHTSRKRSERHKRSDRIYGAFEDSNRWIKCWNCGFVVDLANVSLGDGSGIVPTYIPDHGRSVADELVRYASIDELTFVGACIVLSKTYLPQATAGCPFCGCKNLP